MPRTDVGQCRHHHYRLNGYCPFCSGTLVDDEQDDGDPYVSETEVLLRIKKAAAPKEAR